MALQEFRGKFTLPSAATTFSIGATGCTLTEADYYIAGYTGESATQLVEHMQAVIRAIGATQDASTVAYSGTTGRVTITLETAATLTLSSSLATILGFTSTSYGSGTTFTAERQPRYVWRPSRGAWEYPDNLTAATFWPPESSTVVGRSEDGSPYGVGGYLLYDALIVYRCLTLAEVMTPSTGTVYADLKQFFSDVIHTAKPIRMLLDRTDASSTGYVQFIWGKEGQERIGKFYGPIAYEHRPPSKALWDVEVTMMKDV